MYFAAAAQLAEVFPMPSALASVVASDGDGVGERARRLHKHMARRDRKALTQLAGQFRSIGDPAAWRRAALATGARAGLLYGGDVSAALDALDVGRGGRSAIDDPVALDLLLWMTGDDHLDLRRQLGMNTTSNER